MDTATLTKTVTTTSHPEDSCPTAALKRTELGQEMVQRAVRSHSSSRIEEHGHICIGGSRSWLPCKQEGVRQVQEASDLTTTQGGGADQPSSPQIPAGPQSSK